MDVGGWGVTEFSGRPTFIFLIKENWTCVMTRHYAEPNINSLSNLCFQALTNCINQSIVSGMFPDTLKLTSFSPVYKAKDLLDKINYRPVSVLLLLSKIYER